MLAVEAPHSAIHDAVRRGDVPAVEMLVDAEAKRRGAQPAASIAAALRLAVSRESPGGPTPLHLACRHCGSAAGEMASVQLLRALLWPGCAFSSSIDPAGAASVALDTALELHAEPSCLAEGLFHCEGGAGAGASASAGDADADHRDDHDGVARRIRRAAVNAVTARGVTPLHVACEGGNAAAAQLLLAAGADPNAADVLGRGALAKAVLGLRAGSRSGSATGTAAAANALFRTRRIESGDMPVRGEAAAARGGHHDAASQLGVLREAGPQDEARYAAVIAALAAGGCQYHPRALFVCPARAAALQDSKDGSSSSNKSRAARQVAKRLAAAAAQRLRATGRGLTRLRRAGSDCTGMCLHVRQHTGAEEAIHPPAWPLPCRARESPLHIAVEQRSELLVAALLSAYPLHIMTGLCCEEEVEADAETDCDGEDTGDDAPDGRSPSCRRHSFDGVLYGEAGAAPHTDGEDDAVSGVISAALLAPRSAATPCLTSPRFKKLLRAATSLPGSLAPAAAAAVGRVHDAAAAASCRCKRMRSASAPNIAMDAGEVAGEDAESAGVAAAAAGGAGRPSQRRPSTSTDAAAASQPSTSAAPTAAAAAQTAVAAITSRWAERHRRLLAQIAAPPPRFDGCCACQRQSPLAICAKQLAQAGKLQAQLQPQSRRIRMLASAEQRIALLLIAAGCEPRDGDLTAAGRSPLQQLLELELRPRLVLGLGLDVSSSLSLTAGGGGGGELAWDDDSDADTEDAGPAQQPQLQQIQLVQQLRLQGVDVRPMADFLAAAAAEAEAAAEAVRRSPAGLAAQASHWRMADFLALATATSAAGGAAGSADGGAGQAPSAEQLAAWTGAAWSGCHQEDADWPASPPWKLRPSPVSQGVGEVACSWLAEAAWRRRRHAVAAYFPPLTP